nr:hypothetical protein CFP56_14541 [Quercus suber]
MTNYTSSSNPNVNFSAKSNMIAYRDDKLERLLQRQRRAMEIMAFGTLHDKHNPNMNMLNNSCSSFSSNFPTTSSMIIIPDDDAGQERILLQKQKQKQALEILGYRNLYANYNTNIVARTTSHMPFNRSTLGVHPKSKIHKPIKHNSWYGHGAHHQIPSSMMNLNPLPVFVTKQPIYVMVSSQPATERNGVIGNLQCSNENMSFSDFHANTANNGEAGHECHEGELQELDLSLKL